MAILGQKPWVNFFEKMSIFRLFELVLFIVQKGVYSMQNIIKTFSWPLLPKRKKLKNRPFLDQNHGLTPLKKMSIFRLFELVLFKVQKGFFSLQNIVKTFSWPILNKKKKLTNPPFLDPNHGLTPLKKCQFFDFLNLFFLQSRQAFFRSRIS